MKAALIKEINVMEVSDVPIPEITDGSMLVRIEGCAICGSDNRIVNPVDRFHDFTPLLFFGVIPDQINDLAGLGVVG